MLASHERELTAARLRNEPAAQIAARELEAVRISTALRRADEFDNDVAAASKSQPTRLHGDLAVTSAVGESAIEVPNSHATPTNKHRINAVVAFCSLSLKNV